MESLDKVYGFSVTCIFVKREKFNCKNITAEVSWSSEESCRPPRHKINPQYSEIYTKNLYRHLEKSFETGWF